MVDAEHIKETILFLSKNKLKSPVHLSEVAKTLDLANWEEHMESVRMVAEVMSHQKMISLKDDYFTQVEAKKRF